MRGRQVMILNVLAVGDVVGDSGVEYLSRHLRGLKKLKGVHFTVVNGENASGVGILPRQAREIFVVSPLTYSGCFGRNRTAVIR